VIRRQAGLSVTRFIELAGIPGSTWYRQRQRALSGRPPKGPWPRPARRRVEAVVHAYALKYPVWGHRKIWALTIADGHQVSMRTVHRILDERGLLHSRGYHAERRELAKARRQTFHEPPTRRNRVWQTDFSEFETSAGGTWQLSGVVDYVAKFCLTCPVTATKTWREAVGALEGARERAGEVLGPSADRRSRRPRHRRARADRRCDRWMKVKFVSCDPPCWVRVTDGAKSRPLGLSESAARLAALTA